MDALLSILTVVDIIGKVVGDPGEVLTGYQLSAKSANYYSVCLTLQGKRC
jgi:hypothetical protein